MGTTARIGGFLPLRGYALLGDGRSCALVGTDGAIDWWPLPTMDSPPAFGSLLDPERGGRLTLRPTADFTAARSYVDGGAVLETVFRTADGSVRVTDALNLGDGRLLPWTELARRVEGVEGEVAMRWEVAPGDRFATTAAWARTLDGRPLISAGDQNFALILDGVGAAEQVEGGFRGEFTTRPGDAGLLAVTVTDGEPFPVPAVDAIYRRVGETAEHWARWRGGLIEYEGPWRDAVARSALVHKQLTLTASGGLQAAATTSLPERIGGERNFDYRFSWVRDSGFALDALTDLGLKGEVHTVLSYLLHAVARTAPDVRVFYTMAGDVAPASIEPVRLWRGYRESSPVQVGNSAAGQRQLGVYGDLLEAIAHYAESGNVLDGATERLVVQVAEQVCEQWG